MRSGSGAEEPCLAMVTFPSCLSPGLRSLQARKNWACRDCALPDQQVPVPPGPPKRPRSPVAGSLLGSRETETKATIGHGGSQAADLSAEGGQRAPCHCMASIQSTLREAGLRALRGVSAPYLPPRSGASQGAACQLTLHPASATRELPAWTPWWDWATPEGSLAVWRNNAALCSVSGRLTKASVITAPALGRQLGAGLRNVCE
ncbi:hypothetical protein PAL_GLEAN10003635 [Pteropus alecto]|uniref:Uncharacterized protein n=1 Tax=Pteropus alecto TaxID=9402 RepID=L5L5Z5_PTEAL|nr:hypothetical protein PAL_GLEAN10003635 [Pteropus alecto]